MNPMRAKTDYYRLSCGHIRLIAVGKHINEGKTIVYCVQCDDEVIVKERDRRW